MKKITSLMLVLMLCCALFTGCQSQAKDSGKKTNTSVKTSEEKTTSDVEEKEDEESLESIVYKEELKAFEDIIPIPEFEIDLAFVFEDKCSYQTDDISRDEYDSYVKKCIGRGFIDDVLNIGDSDEDSNVYKAKNADGYSFWSSYDNGEAFFNVSKD